jgi:hypothetical protein
MLQRKSSRLSLNPSKRVERRLRVAIDWIKQNGIKSMPIFFVLLVVYILCQILVVKKIQCHSDFGDCPVEILERLTLEIGSNSIFINQKKLVENIKSLRAIEKVNIGFRIPNTLDVTLLGSGVSYKIEVYLVKELPSVTFDNAPGSTISADWPRPTEEISQYLKGLNGSTFDIWRNGTLTSTASTSAIVKFITMEKPAAQTGTYLYNLVRISQKYLDPQEIILLGNRVFLRQVNQPDIIVSIPFDEGLIIQAFQSLNNLVTIKKDAKIIDLRFKNPIIR